jgi:hypothetical protein
MLMALGEPENMRSKHGDIRALELIRVHHPRELGPRHARVIPHPKVLHPERTGRSFVVACEACG